MYEETSAAPLVSVIIPVFNGREKLQRTLASVLSQPRELWECLVMDGGSTDGTVELLRAQGAQVRWVSERDGGVYDAMNKGIARASGRFLYFLGAGDTLREGALQAMAAYLPLNGLALVYGDVYLAAEGRVGDGLFTPVKLTRGSICHQAAFYSRGIFDKVGLYDLRYPINADQVLNLRCFGDRDIANLYCPVVVADFEGGGLSSAGGDENFGRERLGLIRAHLGLLPYLAAWGELRLPVSVKRARFRLLHRIRSLWARR